MHMSSRSNDQAQLRTNAAPTPHRPSEERLSPSPESYELDGRREQGHAHLGLGGQGEVGETVQRPGKYD